MMNAARGLREVATMLTALVDTNWDHMAIKKCPIGDFYKISTSVLGSGANGRVVECSDLTGEKFALKVGISG